MIDLNKYRFYAFFSLVAQPTKMLPCLSYVLLGKITTIQELE